MTTTIEAKDREMNLSGVSYELKEAGIIRYDDSINPDGKIHHTDLGAYQVILNDDGYLVARWQKWGDPRSYQDRYAKNPRSVMSAITIADRQAALWGDNKMEEWQNYIQENERSARLSAWSSDGAARRYARNAWAVHQFIPANGISWVYGSPGCLKSFFAVDLACHVATGREWAGRKVKQGPVLYVSAEGGGDIHLRRVAWEKDIGVKAEMLKVVSEQPQLDSAKYSDGFNDLRDHITEIIEVSGTPPVLIVIDTFAQTASDDTKDAVSRYTRRLTRLIKDHAPDAAILVIDHTTKEGGTWMGSVAKLGNTDMMCLAKKKGDTMTLSMSGGKGKIKGAPDCEDITLATRVAGSGILDDEGEELTTLVLDYSKKKLNDKQEAMLGLIGQGKKRSELRSLWDEQEFNNGAKDGALRASFNRALDVLEGLDLIEVGGKEPASLIMPSS